MSALLVVAAMTALIAAACLFLLRHAYPQGRLSVMAAAAVGPVVVAAVTLGLQPTQALQSDVETTVVQSVHE